MQDVYASFTFNAGTDKYLLADYPLTEFPETFGVVQLGVNTDAAGETLSIWTGPVQQYDKLVPLVKSTAPIYPDDFLFSFPIAPGQRLVLLGNATAAGTATWLWGLRFLPAG